MIMIPDAKKFYAHKRPFKKVYQFRITLLHIHPHIWRTIQVPKDYSFWDLHVAITDCMPWLDYHLHEFLMKNPRTGKEDHLGIPDPDDDLLGHEVWDCSEKNISSYFSLKNPRAMYLYDFGDGWKHDVTLEAILPREDGVNYPRCIDGKRSGPPEDVGGISGYTTFLEIIKNPKHEEHKERLAWAKYLTGQNPFDPETFEAAEVHFDDPSKRWAVAYGGAKVTPDMRCYKFGKGS